MKRVISLILIALLGFGTIESAALAGEKSQSIVTIAGDSYYVHTVAKGETLYSLSKQYSISEDEIKRVNPQTVDGLQVGHILKIPLQKSEKKLTRRQERRIFDRHTVNKGETLFSISRRYEIPVTTLIEDNEGLDPTSLSIGQVLRIRKDDIGDASQEDIEEQLEEYKDAINSVTDSITYHLVQPKETLYGLSKQYGVTEGELKEANDIAHESELKMGDMIIIPIAKSQSLAEERGDGEQREGALWPWAIDREGDKVDDQREPRYDATIADLSNKSVINVAMFLPLQDDGSRGSDNFLDFYQGSLLALEDLKAEGVSVKLSLHSTSRSVSEIESVVNSREFEETDLIIGPIYESGLRAVTRFAENKGIAVVSPLAAVEELESPVLYQVTPDHSTKQNKLKGIIAEADNIIYISTDTPNQEFEDELRPLLPTNHRRVHLSRQAVHDFSTELDNDGKNVIIVSCIDEYTVDRILATISSMHNNLVARSMTKAEIRVVGSSHWARFRRNIDKNLYFKLKLTYVTSYHADRGDIRVNEFDRRFVSAFGSLPTLYYAYRGYDVVKLFVGATKIRGRDYTQKLNDYRGGLLQMNYTFADRNIRSPKQIVRPSDRDVLFDSRSGAERGGEADPTYGNRDRGEQEQNRGRVYIQVARQYGYVNTEWALVQYNSNYTIEVK